MFLLIEACSFVSTGERATHNFDKPTMLYVVCAPLRLTWDPAIKKSLIPQI
jgi:hypothetical protein